MRREVRLRDVAKQADLASILPEPGPSRRGGKLRGHTISVPKFTRQHSKKIAYVFRNLRCLIPTSTTPWAHEQALSLPAWRPGRFLLTGSAHLMALPTVADSLAGRMETLSLLPLSQSEMQARSANWIDNAFSGRMLKVDERVLRGGYPEAIARATPRRRVTWARQYIDAIIQRDVRDVAGIEKLDQLPRFLRALAQTAGQMCNSTQLGGQVGLDGKTAARYATVFEQMYLPKRIDVWARSRLNRVVKTPTLQFMDSGLLAALLDLTAEEVRRNRTRFGNVLESFVFGELLKHLSTVDGDYRLLYYRDADRFEVDVVIENAAGQLVAVEVKAAATVKESDLRGLKKLASLAGSQLKMGVLLYDGTETMPLGNGIWAAPLSSLWGT